MTSSPYTAAHVLAQQRARSAFLDPARRGAVYLQWAAHHVRREIPDEGQGEALETGMLFVAGVLLHTNRRYARALEALGKIEAGD